MRIEYVKGLEEKPLKELRKMQRIIQKQIEIWNPKKHRLSTLEELQRRDREIIQAILNKTS